MIKFKKPTKNVKIVVRNTSGHVGVSEYALYDADDFRLNDEVSRKYLEQVCEAIKAGVPVVLPGMRHQSIMWAGANGLTYHVFSDRSIKIV